MGPARFTLRAAAAAALLISGTVIQPALASVLTIGFEDIPNEFSKRTEVPAGYAGLTWDANWQTETYGFYNGAFSNDLSVGPQVVNLQHAINLAPNTTVGGAASFASSTPFYLKGLTLTAFLTGNSIRPSTAGAVKVEGVRFTSQVQELVSFTAALVEEQNGTWVARPLTSFDPATSDTDADDWTLPISRLTLTPLELGDATGTLFLADNVQVQFIPLPAAGPLLAGALAALGVLRRRPRRSHAG